MKAHLYLCCIFVNKCAFEQLRVYAHSHEEAQRICESQYTQYQSVGYNIDSFQVVYVFQLADIIEID